MPDLTPSAEPDGEADAGCAFCRIVAGELPSEKVCEWDDALAIRPLGPVTDGHTLVIPKAHVENYATDPDVTALVMRRAAQLAPHIHRQSNLITSAGPWATQTVMHLHVHIVPRRPNDGLALPWIAPAHHATEVEALAKCEGRVVVHGFYGSDRCELDSGHDGRHRFATPAQDGAEVEAQTRGELADAFIDHRPMSSKRGYDYVVCRCNGVEYETYDWAMHAATKTFGGGYLAQRDKDRDIEALAGWTFGDGVEIEPVGRLIVVSRAWLENRDAAVAAKAWDEFAVLADEWERGDLGYPEKASVFIRGLRATAHRPSEGI